MVNTYLKLPEKTKAEQQESKLAWNRDHCNAEPDFYTVGYSGRNIHEFIQVLKDAGVLTVIDVRSVPVSRYKPDFSKNNLKNALAREGIEYVHRPELGVPRDIRSFCIGQDTRDAIWEWYDAYVVPNIAKRNLDEFFNSMEHPVVFMCVEYDPTECHRHRIALGFEELGLMGCDL